MSETERLREDTDSMIDVRNLTKTFGHISAVDHVNLQVNKGELMTLLGPSGCGKTTLLRCITGHLDPDEGRIFIDGKDVTSLPTHKRELGMVFQAFALFPHMTAYENIEFPLQIRGLLEKETKGRVEEAVEMVRLKGLENKYPRQLSGGQQQRIGLARALVYRPKILLMDEPFGSIDAQTRTGLQVELLRIWDETKKTILFVTHNIEEAILLGSRIVVLGTNPGRVLQIFTNPLPRPRIPTDPDFGEFWEKLYNLLKQ